MLCLIACLFLGYLQVNERICAGDMSHEFMKGLVEDLNDAIASKPFDVKPFYIVIHEKKDLLLTNMMLRRVLKQLYRPYPEPSTTVFWHDPQSNETTFCWSLPHTSTFVQYLNNASKYHKDQIKDILAYNKERLDHFGFTKVGKNEDGTDIYFPTPNFKDRPLYKKRNL